MADLLTPDWEPPPADWTLPSGTLHLWRVGLADPASLAEQLYALLSDDERARADRFRFTDDRRCFVISHGVLRVVLGCYTRRDPTSLRFDLGPHGKPALRDGHGLHFNLTHSGDLALIALSPDREVGVDVEQWRIVPDYDSIAARFFSPAEQEMLRGLPPPARARAFLIGWTRKEAVMKALGLGVAQSPESIEVSLEEGRAVVLRIAGRPADQWSMTAFAPAPGFIGALAMQGPPSALSFWERADGFKGVLT
jgi:4'-phosphopantetheinyl transferase